MALRSLSVLFGGILFLTVTAHVLAAERYVNMPYLGPSSPSANFVPDIFWFGHVTPTLNYADVRSWYFNNEMHVIFHIVDKRLYSTGDKVSLYLSFNGMSYRFERPFWGNGKVYINTGSGWTLASIPFSSADGWRGNSPNDAIDDKGWTAEFTIPFTSLGLPTPPNPDASGKIAALIQDKDDSIGTAIPNQIWPETFSEDDVNSWSTLRFGRPDYQVPQTTNEQMITIRHGLNNNIVNDAHVGGHGNCGADYDHWSEWGEANYLGYSQMNIQNQWDISDYPCFSKYYVTFPLDQLPPGKEVVSAKVTMSLFGNAGGGTWGDPSPSAINAIVVSEDFTESTVNWNNGPLAQDTISVTWVNPVQIEPAGPHDWDVSRAVSDAYKNNKPLRLVFYSTDGDYHSGKYFWTSDTGDWNAAGRPTLSVVIGDATATNLLGDSNGDGNVNLTDLATLLSNFGKSSQQWINGDFNNDGSVNLSDLSTLLSNFGKS